MCVSSRTPRLRQFSNIFISASPLFFLESPSSCFILFSFLTFHFFLLCLFFLLFIYLEHTQARKRWLRAIKKVILQNAVKRTAHFLHVVYGEELEPFTNPLQLKSMRYLTADSIDYDSDHSVKVGNQNLKKYSDRYAEKYEKNGENFVEKVERTSEKKVLNETQGNQNNVSLNSRKSIVSMGNVASSLSLASPSHDGNQSYFVVLPSFSKVRSARGASLFKEPSNSSLSLQTSSPSSPSSSRSSQTSSSHSPSSPTASCTPRSKSMSSTLPLPNSLSSSSHAPSRNHGRVNSTPTLPTTIINSHSLPHPLNLPNHRSPAKSPSHSTAPSPAHSRDPSPAHSRNASPSDLQSNTPTTHVSNGDSSVISHSVSGARSRRVSSRIVDPNSGICSSSGIGSGSVKGLGSRQGSGSRKDLGSHPIEVQRASSDPNVSTIATFLF